MALVVTSDVLRYSYELQLKFCFMLSFPTLTKIGPLAETYSQAESQKALCKLRKCTT